MEVPTLSGDEVCAINEPLFVHQRGVMADDLVVGDLVAHSWHRSINLRSSLLGRQNLGPESAVQVSDELHATSATTAAVMASSSHEVMAAAASLYRW